MEARAEAKFIRMSPRKTRLVVDLIRGKSVSDSLTLLKFLRKDAAAPVRKLTESAVANAEHNFKLKKTDLYIKKITVNEGSTLHRWMPRAHGRATPIRKRSCHIAIILDEIKSETKNKNTKT